MEFTACFVVFLLCLFAIYIEMQQHESNIVQAYGQEQQILAQQTAQQAEDILAGTGTGAELEQQVVEQVLAQYDTAAGRYFLFADDSGIVSLRNSSVTQQLQGLTVQQAFETYRTTSGNMTEFFDALSARSSRTVSFTFAADGSRQWISLYFFTQAGHNYLIAICADEDYIKTLYQVQAHNLSMYLFCGLLCVLFFGISVLYILQLMRSGHLVDTLRKDIRGKNVLIQYLATTDAQGQYRDEQTRLYNREFFLHLLTGSRQKKLLPVSIGVLRVRARNVGRQKEAMQEVSSGLMNFASADRIAARSGEDEFSVLFLNTREYRAKRRIRLLAAEMELQDIQVSYGTAQLKSMKQKPEEVYNRARSQSIQ